MKRRNLPRPTPLRVYSWRLRVYSWRLRVYSWRLRVYSWRTGPHPRPSLSILGASVSILGASISILGAQGQTHAPPLLFLACWARPTPFRFYCWRAGPDVRPAGSILGVHVPFECVAFPAHPSLQFSFTSPPHPALDTGGTHRRAKIELGPPGQAAAPENRPYPTPNPPKSAHRRAPPLPAAAPPVAASL
eukprot:scaffold1188_cov124-Isochrysis_galbana.AAC.1